MKFKLYVLFVLSLIILFSIGAVVANENTTVVADAQAMESDVMELPSYDADQMQESEVLGDSIQESFEYNQVSYDFGRITYESNALISEGNVVGKALIPDTIFAWTFTINTTNANITPDSRLPTSSYQMAVIDENNETHYPGPNDPYELVISGLKLPEGLEYVRHYVDLGTYNVTTGLWNIEDLPENSLISLTVISRVVAKTGEYIPGFYVQYEKRYPFSSEAVGFYIWESKLVLSNETKEINYTEEISGYISSQYLPSGRYEIIKFNESYITDLNVTRDEDYLNLIADNVVIGNETYKIVLKLTEENLDNFFMVIDENGTISNYVFYTGSSIDFFTKNLELLFTNSWSYVVAESGYLWCANTDYRYELDDYSNYRVLVNSSTDTENNQSKRGPEPNNNQSTTQNQTDISNRNGTTDTNTTTGPLKYLDITNIFSSSISELTDFLNNDNSKNQENNSLVNWGGDNSLNPIFLLISISALLISTLLILIFITQRKKD